MIIINKAEGRSEDPFIKIEFEKRALNSLLRERITLWNNINGWEFIFQKGIGINRRERIIIAQFKESENIAVGSNIENNLIII